MTLRSRLLAGFTIIFVVVLAAAVFTVNAQRDQLYDQVDAQLMTSPLPQTIRGDSPLNRTPPSEPDRDGRADQEDTVPLDNESISDLYVAVITARGTVQSAIEGQLLTDVPDVSSIVEDLPTETTLRTMDGIDGSMTFRVLFEPATDTSPAVFVAVPVDEIEDTIRQLTYTFAGVAGIVLLVLVLIASWVNRFGLRPIAAMTDVAEAISSGDRERRAELDDDSTEAGRLARAFNVMLDERDLGEAKLRQFVSNASHELRTPLTSIRGYLDLYAAGGFRKPGELDDAMRRLHVEAERMNLLVEDLLVLGTFDEEQSLTIDPVRVDDMLSDIAALTLAAHPDRVITVDTPSPIEVQADRLRLHQAIAALVDNAVRHTPDDSDIRLVASSAADHIEISVVDSGPGLTATEAESVFDRFTRGDPSRNRSTGGSGLGLSITKAIVQAHGGEIFATSTPGAGATFTIRLPSP